MALSLASVPRVPGKVVKPIRHLPSRSSECPPWGQKATWRDRRQMYAPLPKQHVTRAGRQRALSAALIDRPVAYPSHNISDIWGCCSVRAAADNASGEDRRKLALLTGQQKCSK